MTPSDNPAVLALQFAKTHNLDQATQKELEDQLQYQKATLHRQEAAAPTITEETEAES